MEGSDVKDGAWMNGDDSSKLIQEADHLLTCVLLLAKVLEIHSLIFNDEVIMALYLCQEMWHNGQG